ncbi:hypothetical protein KIW84_021664 [Lathyrus oleraceus]|uniref:Uncharacterized protein n=1 Tax=Pisum sativum TaxID=3888 RepID=A0A9D4Y8F4_PEA|nr:hypothetical protein KIW84_021664 [Pisum sativum]
MVVSTDDKGQTAFSDSYFKRKINWLGIRLKTTQLQCPITLEILTFKELVEYFATGGLPRGGHIKLLGCQVHLQEPHCRQEIVLLRKRDTVYTRSTRGFSLWKSKVLGVGGSSLKWSKSIENQSKKHCGQFENPSYGYNRRYPSKRGHNALTSTSSSARRYRREVTGMLLEMAQLAVAILSQSF